MSRRIPDLNEITTQSDIPTFEQCVAVRNDRKTLQVFCDMEVGAATGVEHNIYAYLRVTVDGGTETALLIENLPDLETITTRGKYIYEIPSRSGMSIAAIGVQLVVGAGEIDGEQVWISQE